MENVMGSLIDLEEIGFPCPVDRKGMALFLSSCDMKKCCKKYKKGKRCKKCPNR